MATFLHNLMEGLRGREQFLEDKLSALEEAKADEQYVQEYRDLQNDLGNFKKRVADLQAEGKDFDEHFERKIKDDHRELEVRIDTWSKTWDTKH
ncbi:MAG: hypothetical protein JJ850_13410 [Kordiimonadaceae bacterium]|nr:hypothetical protein [Kordiimonadaceae bacterium]MBO6570290.1 hypothetical protein [Kordiimonadaceae bacterium]MBO6965612.1 hypothetical protein [Kordiimonadaceae bacterium]